MNELFTFGSLIQRILSKFAKIIVRKNKMGFNCNRVNYPLKDWIKRSFIFSFCIVSILAIDIMYQDQPAFWCNILIAFICFFGVIVFNLLIHIHFDLKDPVKSPVYVKLLSFLSTLAICSLTFYVTTRLGVINMEEKRILNTSTFGFILLMVVRAAILNFIVQLWLYFVMNDHFRNQLELERSKLDKLNERAVNQMLRQQVQPHFLFNALSSLKSLIKKDSAMAESYLLQLSDYLRASFTTSEDGLATVKQEIQLCEDYLNMQKIRFNDAISYAINVSESVLKDSLPVFSLQPLVDNALKHNQYTVEHPLYIEVVDQDGWIIVRNNVCPRKTSHEDNNNYGLNNLKERFSYYLKESVHIHDHGNSFEVHVKIITP
ncbi:sensor histidine kinase [Sphingobacterium pedocola]|nr:histidine kinase [Sphingobacterium pedocola]